MGGFDFEKEDPYQSPARLEDPEPAVEALAEGASLGDYLAPTARVAAVKILLWIATAAEVAYAIGLMLLWDAAPALEAADTWGAQPSTTPLDILDTVYLVAGSLVQVAGMIVLMTWVYRAYKNLFALDGEGIRYTPGWAVGYWFIPIVNLFRPVQVMNDIWRCGASRAEAERVEVYKTPGLISAWWATYLVSAVLSNVATSAGSLGALLASSAVTVPSLLLTIAVVARSSARQSARHAELSAAGAR